MSDETDTPVNDYTAVVAEVVAAYVSNNHVQAAELPGLIRTVHAAVAGLTGGSGGSAPAGVEKPTSIQIRRSITPEHLISFVDGKPYKTLKRHLRTHGLTMDAYRARYGLPRDYPAVAAAYAETRSKLAREIGLGRPRRAAPGPADEPAAAAEAGSRQKDRSRKGEKPAAAG